ncbi:MAG: hypothetical protein IKG14_01245 [Clostridia bacterium]|nr:hypothetical protein [Clostridia bacterium]
MPKIDFTNPYFSISAIVLFVLCVYLARNMKSNTVPCIMLLAFLAILVGHVIELSVSNVIETTVKLTICVIIDEAFTFASFLAFLWLDKVQVDTLLKSKSKGKNKGKREVIIKDDGLDILWRQV